MERHGDSDGDGYIEYQTRNPKTGLVNQCWKDSGNSIVHPDGRLATLPRACCEIQGYAYDARVRAARLAREVWGDPAFAERLEQDAAALRDRFDRTSGCPTSASTRWRWTGDKKPVGTLTSNMGTCCGAASSPTSGWSRLWRSWPVTPCSRGGASGHWPRARRVQPDRVPQRHGVAPRHRAHRGRAGPLRPAAGRQRLGVALLEAAGHFAYRLPEAFAGYPRRRPGAGGVPERVLAAGVGERGARCCCCA
jgi:hypothetical protein